MALCNHFSEEAHGRRAWDGAAPLGIDATHWSRLVEDVVQALRRAAAVLNPLQEHSPEFRTLYQRCEVQADQLSMFNQSVPDGMVRWLELGASLRILQSPMHIAQTMRAYLQNWNEKDSLPGGRSWIFTSATLGHDAALGLFIETCGLEGARVLQVDSPFNYALQGAVYVPEHLPLPAHALHSDCVALLVSQGAEILGGRTLVLTTTLRAMRSIGDALKSNLLLEHGIEVLVQGQMSKRELVERFCQAGKGSAPGAVLVACASFWEGIDVPGEDLQLVVIDKLPFSPPDDPLVEARSRYLELIGKKPFQHLHVPQAVLALKQGAGRLIRSETDQGVLVICDTRLLHKGYGRRMLAALPPMKRLVDYTEFIGALQGLTRTSTTNPDPP
jgi:ATP-dependent DNA helicase DinG